MDDIRVRILKVESDQTKNMLKVDSSVLIPISVVREH